MTRSGRTGSCRSWWRPGHEADCLLRELSPRRISVEGRYPLQLRCGWRGEELHERRGQLIPRRPRLTPAEVAQRASVPGDALVDELPTLTISTDREGRPVPPGAASYRIRARCTNGPADALDSVARNAPACRSRLQQPPFDGRVRGRARCVPRGLNPFNFPAQESVALLLLDAHRMLGLSLPNCRSSRPPEALPGRVPEEAPAQAAREGDLNLLINDITVLRATATFMRTAVTRDTPWTGSCRG